jgi:AcrR family transcriptional regulator
VVPNVPLRARQRKLSQDTILNAALHLFRVRGYSKTTIQMIAEQAGVGVATIFRHFRSKPGLVAALMRREVEVIFDRGNELIDQPGADPVEAMMKYLMLMLTAWDVPITRIRGFSRLWLALPTGHPDADALVHWGDSTLLSMIRRLLEHFQSTGKLTTRLDVGAMSEVTFAVFNQVFIGLATGDERSMKQARTDLRRRVPLLFADWLAPTAAGASRARKRGRKRSPLARLQ